MQSGNFLALSFESEDAEKIETKVINGDSDKYVNLTTDRYCVYRIRDNKTQKIEVRVTKGDESESRIYSLAGLNCNPCPVGEAAFQSQDSKTDYGQFGNTTTFYKNINVSWSGTKAKVTGELNYVDKSQHDELPKLWTSGNFFAFALTGWFNGKPITVIGNSTKTASDTDWVMNVTEETKSKGITVKYNDTVIAMFDFSDVTLAKQS